MSCTRTFTHLLPPLQSVLASQGLNAQIGRVRHVGFRIPVFRLNEHIERLRRTHMLSDDITVAGSVWQTEKAGAPAGC